MALNPLPGFKAFDTHHCITGSMRHIYAFNEHPISEEMLLGLGEGVGFIYWHQKGMDPFIGGRATPKKRFEGFEELAGERTGVLFERHTTSSASRAEESLLATLEAGQPVMIQCDMGFLPYFDFGGEDYHFGGHAIVVCGCDADARQTLVADRDGLHEVSMDDLARARGSTHKPFPPGNLWFTHDFAGRRAPTPDEVRQAVRAQVERMLAPPISNFGVDGIRKAARTIPKWPGMMDEGALRRTMFNTYIFIGAEGGTGGGIFRYMFGRFLQEAATITGIARLSEVAEAFQQAGDRWEAVGRIFRDGRDSETPADVLVATTAPLLEIADLEGAAWSRLSEVVG
jgi:hypothetical protein